MELHLKHDAKDSSVLLWLNGQLAGELAVGTFVSRDMLLAEVSRARRLEWMPRAVVELFAELQRHKTYSSEGLSRDQAEVEWVDGMLDGFKLVTCANPDKSQLVFGVTNAEIRPSALVPRHSGRSDKKKAAFSGAYKAGYCFGERIRVVIDRLMEMEKAITEGCPWHNPPGLGVGTINPTRS